MTDLIFPNDFELYHLISLNKSAFGNLLANDTFLAYYNIIPDNSKDALEIFADRSLETSIYAEFEHDRSEFNVRFQNAFINKNKDIPSIEKSVISASYKYNSIRRIVVDDRSKMVRIFIQVRYPPKLRQSWRIENNGGKNKGSETTEVSSIRKFRTKRILRWKKFTDQYVAESPFIMIEFHDKSCLMDLLGRLKTYTVANIEMKTVTITKRDFYLPFLIPEILETYDIAKSSAFDIRFCLESLVSRGGIVKDMLLLDEERRDEFLKTVTDSYHNNKSNTIDVLEQLLCIIDETLVTKNLKDLFEEIKESGRVSAVLQQQRNANWESQGYLRVRKVIITPTRRIFVTPELMMGNRVLRKHGVDRFLRVVFRDEDGMRLSKFTGDSIIDQCVKKVLNEGFTVVDRNYVMVGSSNSQLRDNGCYFVYGDTSTAVEIRKSMGRFKIEKVPKMMARIGQCFTQSKLSQIKLDRSQYTKIGDFIGQENSKGEPFVFSDGVGSISYDYAKQISADLSCRNTIPSCFQFRFRGFKGVLSVDPVMDLTNKFLTEHGIDGKELSIQFRESQEKFKAPRNECIEIVKYSTPSLVFLNKPMINIIDQVSKVQSEQSHQRICKSVHKLLNRHINHIMSSLNKEDCARRAFSEFPQLIFYQHLMEFALTQEPFFQSLLRAYAKSMLSRLLSKMKIRIPPYMGRTMFGIVDTTGILQSGQVFIQYNANYNDRLPSPNSKKIVHKGRVLVTKNPSVVAGDVRMFEAVDIVPLRHLVDVIVFPSSGERPHPDEMAGSDLDGDEYAVIWDSDLFLDKNEKPFDYCAGTNIVDAMMNLELEDDDDGEKFQQMMTEFFVRYITQDSIGQISNAHLANSDLYGINSKVCENIAVKHNQSVDFPKTGISPDKLTFKWNADIPPEKIQYFPDFMDKRSNLTYKSKNLLGQLHRSVHHVQRIIETSEIDIKEEIELDPALSYFEEGLEDIAKNHMTFVKEQRRNYVAQIMALMDTYGIKSEGELFSGHYSEVKGKATDSGNNDDVSLFNMATICQQRLESIFATFRENFFEHFTEGMSVLYSLSGTRNQTHIVLDGMCTSCSEEMKAVAIAYYQTAYKDGNYLSFAWLVWDILSIVKKIYCLKNKILRPIDPLGEKLTQMIDSFCSNAADGYYKDTINKVKEMNRFNGISKIIHQFVVKHQGLGKFFCYLACWRDLHQIELDNIHLFILIIIVGNCNLDADVQGFEPFLCKESDLEYECHTDNCLSNRGVGRILIDLLSCFSSNAFRNMSSFKTELNGEIIEFTNDQLVSIHSAALVTYYQLSLTSSINVLPSTDHKIRDGFSPIVESPPIVIKIPNNHIDECIELLRIIAGQKFDCEHIAFRVRKLFYGDASIIAMVVSGKMGKILSFYDFLSIEPITAQKCFDISHNLEVQCWRKLSEYKSELIN